MPKVESQGGEVEIHAGDWWKEYEKHPSNFVDWGWEDPGREHMSRIKMAKVKGEGWVIYSWWFESPEQVEYDDGVLTVKDSKAAEIIDEIDMSGIEVEKEV